MPAILIVDDEPTIRALVRSVLEGRGYRTVEAADGISALKLAVPERPDLILLDVALPGLSGLEVCRRLKNSPATASIPVLLLTGVLQQAERQIGADAGAQGFIAKPFSPAALVAQIDEALRQHAAIAPR